jgi:hypothetical protein
MKNKDEKEKTTYLSLFCFPMLFYSFSNEHTNVDKPTGNVVTFTHRKPNQATAISFFNHFSSKD